MPNRYKLFIFAFQGMFINLNTKDYKDCLAYKTIDLQLNTNKIDF